MARQGHAHMNARQNTARRNNGRLAFVFTPRY
jgi:hypothetical protein